MNSSNSMSELLQARAQLEGIQRNTFVELGMPVPSGPSSLDDFGVFDAYMKANPEYSAEQRKQFFEERRFSIIDGRLDIARLADVGSAQILASRVDQLRDAWPEHLFPGVLQKVCFGTIPGGGLEAYTFRTDGRDAYGVVIPEGLFYLFNLFTKLVLLLQPFTATTKGLVYMPSASFEQFARASHPYIKFRTSDILKAYFVVGEPRASLPYVRAIPFQDHISYLLIGAELFVLAHEVAHVALGHLNHLDAGQFDLEIELDADDFALDVVAGFFDKTENLGLVRASLCGALFLSVVRLWERAMEYAFDSAHIPFHDETHPTFKKRHHRFVSKLEESPPGSTPGWYIFIHNGIRIATELMTEKELPAIIDSGGGLQGLSARVLPASHKHLGQMKGAREDQWPVTIAELLTAADPKARRLGLWFLVTMAPQSALGLYEGIVDEDQHVNITCRDAICSIEPMYKAYLPRLLERFRETDRDDALADYKMSISSYLLTTAAAELGEDRVNSDPMSPSFFEDDGQEQALSSPA